MPESRLLRRAGRASIAAPVSAYSWFCQPRTAASTFGWALPFCLPARAMGAAAPAAKVAGGLPRA